MANRPTQGEAAPRAYAALQSDIITGRLQGGHPLVEDTLAQRYGVSRTPIREALRRLEHDGLVHRSSRGYEIRRYTAEELYELYETRTLLEGFAARRAAERHGPVDAARMTECHNRMAALPDEAEIRERIDANRRFHTAVWRAANNRTMHEVLARLHLSVVRHTTLTDPTRWHYARMEHEQVLNAILGGHPDEAEALMVAHLETGRDVALRLHQRQPLPPP